MWYASVMWCRVCCHVLHDCVITCWQSAHVLKNTCKHHASKHASRFVVVISSQSPDLVGCQTHAILQTVASQILPHPPVSWSCPPRRHHKHSKISMTLFRHGIERWCHTCVSTTQHFAHPTLPNSPKPNLTHTFKMSIRLWSISFMMSLSCL